MILMDMTVTDFAAELASLSPAPGGGTIAAVNGVFAAGLGSMVCALSLRKPKDADAEAVLDKAKAAMDLARARLLSLADEDTEAFNRVMAAYKLPKETPEEKAARSQAIGLANIGATQVPLETAEKCVQVCRGLEGVAACANDNVMSDCGVALECAKTGALGAFMNVAINLPGVKDEAVAADMRHRLDAMKAELDAGYRAAKATLDERFPY